MSTSTRSVEMGFPPHIETARCLAETAGGRGHRILIAGGAAFDLLTVIDLRTVADRKESGVLRDVDVIKRFDTPIEEIVEEVGRLLTNPTKIDAALSNVVQITTDGTCLVYNKVAVPVHPGIFDPVNIEVGGVTIPVLRPQTLYEMLGISHGTPIRRKDKKRAEELAKIFDNFPLPFDPDNYKVFDEFHNVRRHRYPFTAWMLEKDVARTRSRVSLVKMFHYLPGGHLTTKLIREGLFKLEEKLVDSESVVLSESGRTIAKSRQVLDFRSVQKL